MSWLKAGSSELAAHAGMNVENIVTDQSFVSKVWTQLPHSRCANQAPHLGHLWRRLLQNSQDTNCWHLSHTSFSCRASGGHFQVLDGVVLSDMNCNDQRVPAPDVTYAQMAKCGCARLCVRCVLAQKPAIPGCFRRSLLIESTGVVFLLA